MGLISMFAKQDYLPTKEDIYGTRITVDNFPIFTKIDPPNVLEYYLDSCIEEGIDPFVDPFNLPETCPYAYRKRKKEAQGKGSSGPQTKKKKKVDVFLDEDELPLSECQKSMILKDTSGVVQQSSKAPDTPIPGKSSTTITLFTSDSQVSESVLQTQPYPSPSSSLNPIPRPPPTNLTVIEPVIETPIVSKTHIQQQQIP